MEEMLLERSSELERGDSRKKRVRCTFGDAKRLKLEARGLARRHRLPLCGGGLLLRGGDALGAKLGA